MSHGIALALHIGAGALALAAYWYTLTSRKGSPRHRGVGRICLVLLVLVSLSVGPVLFSLPGPFDPGYAVQMIYLVTCIATVSMLAFRAIRFKADPTRFGSGAFAALGPVLLVLGLVVLAAGIARTDPVAVTLSWVGLAFGAGMIAFRSHSAPLHPRWWLGWHLNATCALFNAVNGTFLYVAARSAGLVPESAMSQAGFQLATVAAAVALRLWFGARYDAPIAFGIKRARAGITAG